MLLEENNPAAKGNVNLSRREGYTGKPNLYQNKKDGGTAKVLLCFRVFIYKVIPEQKQNNSTAIKRIPYGAAKNNAAPFTAQSKMSLHELKERLLL